MYCNKIYLNGSKLQLASNDPSANVFLGLPTCVQFPSTVTQVKLFSFREQYPTPKVKIKEPAGRMWHWNILRDTEVLPYFNYKKLCPENHFLSHSILDLSKWVIILSCKVKHTDHTENQHFIFFKVMLLSYRSPHINAQM